MRALNRLNYLNVSYSQSGEIFFANQNLKSISDNILRKKIGIIFALPQVLPVSIYNNIAYGPKVHGITEKDTVNQIVEEALKKAYLWEEVKDRLDSAGGETIRRSAAAALHSKDTCRRAGCDSL